MKKRNKRKFAKKGQEVLLLPLTAVALLLFISIIFILYFQSNNLIAGLIDLKPTNVPSPTHIAVTVSPTITPSPTVTTSKTYNPDPVVSCPIYSKCGGGYQMLKKSVCAQSTCCQIGNNWIFYLDHNKCTQDQVSLNKGSTTNNNQLKAAINQSVYASCMNLINITRTSCYNDCKSQLDRDFQACNIAYSGTDPSYQDCLNGATNENSACITACSAKGTDTYNSCISGTK